MGAYDGRADLSETIADSLWGDTEAWLESDHIAKRRGTILPKQFLAQFEDELDAGQHPKVYPPQRFAHSVTLHLTDNQFRMLRQSARHDGCTPEEAVLEQMRAWTHETLYFCYGHQPDRIDHGWQPAGPKPPRVAEVDEETRRAKGRTAPSEGSRTSEESVLDFLTTEAGMAVLRYLYQVPWDYQSADVVSACVTYAFQQVFNALEEMKGVVPEGDDYRDNAWGWLEERIDKFVQQRNGTDPAHPDLHPAFVAASDAWRLDSSKGLGFSGPSGHGKTRALCLALRKADAAGASIAFCPALKLAALASDQFHDEARRRDAAQQRLRYLFACRVLLLDDLGKEKLTERTAAVLSDLIEDRTCHRRLILWSSQFSGAQLITRLGEDRGTAIARRLRQYTDPTRLR